MPSLHVAYVLLRFPQLTETFVAEEMIHMWKKGIHLYVYSLLPSRDQLVHPVSQQLLPLVKYAPSIFSASLWFAQVYYLSRAPARYVRLLATFLREPAPRLSFRLRRLYVFLKSVWLAKQLEHQPVELVHTHFAWLSAIAGIVAKELLGIPFTVTAHAYDIYSKRNDLLRLAARFADRIITISEANKQAILSMSPSLAPSKVEVLRCGIDLERFRPVPHSSVNKTLQIISVGSLLPKKGHEYLMRACARLQQEKVDFHCTIVGSGNLQQPLQRLVCELGLQERITLAGARPHDWVRNRLAESDLFVLACVTDEISGKDGIPVALMEAMAIGIPVISTEVSGIPELVRNEWTGLLVPERDPAALAAAMLQIAHNEPLRGMLAKNALDLVCQDYDIVKNTDRLQALFGQSTRAARPASGGVA